MKKIMFFMALSAILFTGCGKNKNEVTCKQSLEENGVKYSVEVVGKLKNDKIANVDATMKFSDENTTTTMCGFLALAKSMGGEDAKGFDYSCDKKTIKITGYDQMSSEEEDTPIGLSKAEFIKKMEASDKGVTCK